MNRISFRSSRLLALVLVHLAVTGDFALAADLYVSPTGDDSHTGAADQPFKTLARARDQARTLASGMAADIHVWLADGIYPQAVTLTFDARDSGQNFCNIIYEAQPGAHPVISGGRQIMGWTLRAAAKNIWAAPAANLATRQLYVNGVRAIRARGDTAFLKSAQQTATGYVVVGKCPLKDWSDINQAEFGYNFLDGGIPGGGQWVEPRLGIDKVLFADGKTTIVMKQPGYAVEMKLDKQIRAGLPSFIENAYALLDQPGEWYLDQKAGQIYYIPRQGEDMTKATAIAAETEVLVHGQGTAENALHNLQFKGITFSYATWLKPSGDQGFTEGQANHMADDTYPPGEVTFQHANNLRFERCTFSHLGSAGLELSQGVQDSLVIGCVFKDISGCGLLQGTMLDPDRSDVRLREDNNRIEDCLFDHIGQEYHGAVAVLSGYVSHTLIAHNEIDHVPYTGISIGWGWGRKSYASNNRVEANKVDGFLESLDDGGAFYALSPQLNSELDGNWFLNQATDRDGGAIYPDEGSAGWEIHHNVTDAVKRWLYIWTGSIRNLDIHDNWTSTSVVRNNGTNIALANNTVVAGPWPEPAQQIMKNAGLEPAWADIARPDKGKVRGGN